MIVIMFGVVIALAAAARSTWSPCGLSMLSQITPMAEAGRGQKFARTASWFIAGAVLGGLTLGCAIAGRRTRVAAPPDSVTPPRSRSSCCAFVGATVDTNVLGFGPPFLRRQVNEDWLSKYRSWVYGGGFGWQIGVGVTTYVMTAAVPLMIVVGALEREAVGGARDRRGLRTPRGLAVLMGAPANARRSARSIAASTRGPSRCASR